MKLITHKGIEFRADPNVTFSPEQLDVICGVYAREKRDGYARHFTPGPVWIGDCAEPKPVVKAHTDESTSDRDRLRSRIAVMRRV